MLDVVSMEGLLGQVRVTISRDMVKFGSKSRRARSWRQEPSQRAGRWSLDLASTEVNRQCLLRGSSMIASCAICAWNPWMIRPRTSTPLFCIQTLRCTARGSSQAMGVLKLLLLTALFFAVVVLSEFPTAASAGRHHHHAYKHRQHRHLHHRKHRTVKHPPPPPAPPAPARAPPPPPPPTLPPGQPGRPCNLTFGPWPPTVPAGSQSFNDGAHANFSQLTVIFTSEGISSLLVEWSDPASFFLVQHGAESGALNFTFAFDLSTPEDNVVFRQVGGTYTAAGLDSISFLDSNGNLFIWGAADPTVPDPTGVRTSFQSPPGVGYVVGLFGAANETALTQIGVCVTGA